MKFKNVTTTELLAELTTRVIETSAIKVPLAQRRGLEMVNDLTIILDPTDEAYKIISVKGKIILPPTKNVKRTK